MYRAICSIPNKILEGLKTPIVQGLILAMAAAGMLLLASK